MGTNSKIQWTDHTFNAWYGCQKVSPGCKNCYAERWATRYGKDFAVRTLTSETNWRQPGRWNAGHGAFFARNGRRQRVFCNSLADVFDNQARPEWRSKLFDCIDATPHLIWLIPTKRIRNVSRMLRAMGRSSLPPNVWLGLTVCTQEEADRDIDDLLDIKATRHFVSVEPLLSSINLAPWLRSGGLDWVIVGGESGTNVRPMHPAWVRAIRNQCFIAGVSFFFKQWGAWLAVDQMSSETHDKLYRSRRKAKKGMPQVVMDDLYGKQCQVQHRCLTVDGQHADVTDIGAWRHSKQPVLAFEVTTEKSGRMLDGREWNEVPPDAPTIAELVA